MTNDETTPQPSVIVNLSRPEDLSLKPVNNWIYATFEEQDAKIKDLQRQVTRQRNCILALIFQIQQLREGSVRDLEMDVLEQFDKECAEEEA